MIHKEEYKAFNTPSSPKNARQLRILPKSK